MARNNIKLVKTIRCDRTFRVMQTIRTVRDSNNVKLGTIQEVRNDDGTIDFFSHTGRYSLSDDLIDSAFTIRRPSYRAAKAVFHR